MKCTRAGSITEKMTLSELLLRKMHDYGFNTVREFGNFVGIDSERLHYHMSGKTVYPRREVRVKLCQSLDIAPEVLDRAIINSMGGNKL